MGFNRLQALALVWNQQDIETRDNKRLFVSFNNHITLWPDKPKNGRFTKNQVKDVSLNEFLNDFTSLSDEDKTLLKLEFG